MPIIKPLLLKDQPCVTDFLARHPPEISELTFTNLFAWRHSRPIFHLELDNSLLFLLAATSSYPTEEYVLLGSPVGDISILEIAATLGNSLCGAMRITADQALPLEQAGFHPEEDRNNADYVYLTADLANLNGRHYAKKRNHIKRCLQNYRCEYVPFSTALISECLTMQERWCQARQCGKSPGLCQEYEAIIETFALYPKSSLIGGAIRVDGVVEAYALAERLNHDTAVWHFEKAMPEVEGLGQLINHWFAKHGLSSFRFVNREQDLGITGLRQAKESYHPHHMVKKFTVRLGKTPLETGSPKIHGCAACD